MKHLLNEDKIKIRVFSSLVIITLLILFTLIMYAALSGSNSSSIHNLPQYSLDNCKRDEVFQDCIKAATANTDKNIKKDMASIIQACNEYAPNKYVVSLTSEIKPGCVGAPYIINKW